MNARQGFFSSLSSRSHTPSPQTPLARTHTHTHPRLPPPSLGATVEVVSGRGMTPNLTGVEPYLYSLHSRFCFKGFVYTRPINHLLPTHNSGAFKVSRQSVGRGRGEPEGEGGLRGDNAACRCPCKSPSLSPFTGRRKEVEAAPSSPLPLLSPLCAALGLDGYLRPSLPLRPPTPGRESVPGASNSKPPRRGVLIES